MRKEHPELYRVLRVYYRQDPAAWITCQCSKARCQIQELPVAASPEVLVCGGGTAGVVVAAIAAARAGRMCWWWSSWGCWAGLRRQGWVTPMMPNKILTESLTHGINDDILHRAAQYDPPPTEASGDLLWFNPVHAGLCAG